MGFQKSLRISEVEGWVFKEVWELSRLRFWIKVREFWKGSSKILKIWGENEGRSFEVFREFSCIETSFYHPSTFCSKIYMYLYLHKSLNFHSIFKIFFCLKPCENRQHLKTIKTCSSNCISFNVQKNILKINS